MDLNYLMTSDFNEGLKPEELIALLLKFRYEYRSLNAKNESLKKEIEKLTIEIENINGLLYDAKTKSFGTISFLEEEIQLLKKKLNRKLTFKERLFGKING